MRPLNSSSWESAGYRLPSSMGVVCATMLSVWACGSERPTCQGAEGCACHPDGTCPDGLLCVSGRCEVDGNGGSTNPVAGGSSTSVSGMTGGGTAGASTAGTAGAGVPTDQAGRGGIGGIGQVGGEAGSVEVGGNAGGGGVPSPVGAGGASGQTDGDEGGTAGTASGGAAGACAECAEDTPTVLLLLDGSSSLFEPREERWDVVYGALMDPVDGVVAAYQDQLFLGFAVFRGLLETDSEQDPACAELAAVPFATNNYEAIDALYSGLGDAWEMQGSDSPTGHAVTRATELLVASDVGSSDLKYMVLITDGNPDTCEVVNPQCGQDLSVKALQDARAEGIVTMVLGFGELALPGEQSTGCNAAQARCGLEHLQDLANAGAGQPVMAPPPEYVYQACVAGEQGSAGTLLATYSNEGGNALYYTDTSHGDLVGALSAIMDGILADTPP